MRKLCHLLIHDVSLPSRNGGLKPNVFLWEREAQRERRDRTTSRKCETCTAGSNRWNSWYVYTSGPLLYLGDYRDVSDFMRPDASNCRHFPIFQGETEGKKCWTTTSQLGLVESDQIFLFLFFFFSSVSLLVFIMGKESERRRRRKTRQCWPEAKLELSFLLLIPSISRFALFFSRTDCWPSECVCPFSLLVYYSTMCCCCCRCSHRPPGFLSRERV